MRLSCLFLLSFGWTPAVNQDLDELGYQEINLLKYYFALAATLQMLVINSRRVTRYPRYITTTPLEGGGYISGAEAIRNDIKLIPKFKKSYQDLWLQKKDLWHLSNIVEQGEDWFPTSYLVKQGFIAVAFLPAVAGYSFHAKAQT